MRPAMVLGSVLQSDLKGTGIQIQVVKLMQKPIDLI